jgi:two-component system NtrC family sensor kinase
MRVGVSGKVFLGYAVLLLAFATTATFSILQLHRARQHGTSHDVLLAVQSRVEAAWRHLDVFAESGRGRPTVARTYFVYAGDSLEEARGKLERFLAEEPASPSRRDFQSYVGRLVHLERLTAETGEALIPYFENSKDGFEQRFAALTTAIDIFKQELRKHSQAAGEQTRDRVKQAVTMAIFLGVAGFLGALGALFWLWRALRPLQALRLRARRIASGDYAERIGLHSRDEIGDLAREFDSMAWALEEREQRLIRSERLATVGKVAAQITHEIRNPLASIGLNAELLGDELGEGQDEGRRLVRAITGEVDRLTDITESYLRYVRLPRPKLVPEDPGALVSAVMEFTRAELAQAGITLEVVAPAGLPDIAADENQLRQALLNLARNAREAMPRGGRLRVAVSAHGEGAGAGAGAAGGDGPAWVKLVLTDDGPGIAPELLGRVFEPFFSTKAKGTGLGLALVQQIVTEHGGRIEVGSGPAGGTSFTLAFPAVRQAGASPQAAPARAEPAGDKAQAELPFAGVSGAAGLSLKPGA